MVWERFHIQYLSVKALTKKFSFPTQVYCLGPLVSDAAGHTAAQGPSTLSSAMMSFSICSRSLAD